MRIHSLLLLSALTAPSFAQPGTLDTSFGNNGLSAFTVVDLVRNENIYGAVMQPDGKLVVAGYVLDPDFMSRAFLARLLEDGSLDPDFGNGGLVHTGTGPSIQLYDIAIDGDGKLIVCGAISQTTSTVGQDAYIARYNSNGTADASFGNGGSLTLALSANTDYLLRVVARSDGRYHGLARAGHSSASDACLFMFTASGQLDNSFSGDGKLCNLFGSTLPQSVAALNVRADGAVIAAGGGGGNKVVAVLPTGAFDNSFGSGGVRLLTPEEAPGGILGITERPDGSIFCAGGRTFAPFQLYATRLLANGAIDPSFGGTGTTSYFNSTMGIAIQPSKPLFLPDGSVLIGWKSIDDVTEEHSVVITRLSSGGAPDWTDFIDIGPLDNDQDMVRVLTQAPDGDVLAACSYTDGWNHITVARFHGDGSTGVPEMGHQRLSLAPNPARSQVQLRLSDELGSSEILIHDALGRKVFSTRSGIARPVTLDISVLRPGRYVVTIRGAHSVAHAALVIEP